MGGHGEKLTRKQEAAIAALLGSFTVEQAAELVGVNAKTLLRWMQRPDFKAEYRAARLAVVEGTINELVHLCSKAVATLKKNMTCGSPQAENRAAELILAHAGKGLEFADLAQRVEELEALYHAEHQGSGDPAGTNGQTSPSESRAGDPVAAAG